MSFPCGTEDKNFPDGHKGRLSLYNPKNEADCGFWGIWIEKADLEQSTGMRDKNGKEIYSRDILRDKYGNTGPCEWVNTCWLFLDTTGYMDSGEKWEVVGNTHENPELLEVKS